MSRQPKFALEFAPETVDHLDAIERKYHRLIEKTIDEQLSYTPERETRNRKPLERSTSFGATWELRFGANNRFRAFYEVDAAEQIVEILAIGVKEGDRLFVGGKEIQI
jgi:mRNA-degrading endonuclease RelE of RelBE toxin-antitoxin system